jgi:hypothetical protein
VSANDVQATPDATIGHPELLRLDQPTPIY